MASSRTTSEDYTRPYRPLSMKLFNSIGPALGANGRLPSAEALMARAQKKTGLSDFGDEVLAEPLKKLVPKR